MTYETPAALRAALEQRLRTLAEGTGTDLGRLRRRAAFERILVRLDAAEPNQWILKGGMALELRFRGRARATRDTDLVRRDDPGDDRDLREQIIDALSLDVDGDSFQFEVGRPTPLQADEAGRPGWRVSVTARLAGRTFEVVKLDVVARQNEITATERLPLPGLLGFAGLETHSVEVVGPRQHFAEKLHAFTRDYDGRPSGRTKDLVDLVMLIDDGLRPGPDLRASVEHVFQERNLQPVPRDLPDAPIAWRAAYEELAAELDVSAKDLDSAMDAVRTFWRQTEDAT